MIQISRSYNIYQRPCDRKSFQIIQKHFTDFRVILFPPNRAKKTKQIININQSLIEIFSYFFNFHSASSYLDCQVLYSFPFQGLPQYYNVIPYIDWNYQRSINKNEKREQQLINFQDTLEYQFPRFSYLKADFMNNLFLVFEDQIRVSSARHFVQISSQYLFWQHHIKIDIYQIYPALKYISFVYQAQILQLQNLMQMQSCPILYPTEEQFNHFYEYVHFLDKNYKTKYGMVKVIPPACWKPKSVNYQKLLEKLIVKNPIEQNVQGISGFFESKNFVLKNMTFKSYRKYSLKQSQKVKGKTPEQKQKLFWKTITYSSPIYGADIFNTFMDETAGSWNLNNLDSVLRYSFQQLVEGVNEPYIYVGTWKAFFSWHKEDLDLSAINYIHEGEPKIWYSIANADSQVLENAAKNQFRDHYAHCKEFLRHKTFLINPEVLLKENANLKISKMIHNAGQIMLVFGGAYHCGFNCGFNIAEAVNYATVDWLRQIINFVPCSCSRKNIKAEKQLILYNLEQSATYSQLQQQIEFKQLKDAVQSQKQLQIVEKSLKGEEINSSQKVQEKKTLIQDQIPERQKINNSSKKPCAICKIKSIAKPKKGGNKKRKRQ